MIPSIFNYLDICQIAISIFWACIKMQTYTTSFIFIKYMSPMLQNVYICDEDYTLISCLFVV